MEYGGLTQTIDVAQVVLIVFLGFFAALIYHLQREGQREGYPLVSDATGKTDTTTLFPMPEPKTFKLADGRMIAAPNGKGDLRPIRATAIDHWPGSPIAPDGDPMTANVGPGSYAERADIPDVTYEGHPRIVPMRVAGNFHVDARDPDLRGMAVMGADKEIAGKVSDIWVDRSEFVIRYVEVALNGGGRTVMLPINFASIDKAGRTMTVDAILARHFTGVPAIKTADKVTLLEEDKIAAYYGAGTLYATPDRQEPII
jgi:photosynthetic reaction center H subunit